MNKISFFHILIGLLAIHIIINCFHSVTVSPFFHSGMYSERFTKPDSLLVFEITVNDKILNAGDFGIMKWDMVHAPLTTVTKQEVTNDFEFDKRIAKNTLNKIGLSKVSLLISNNWNNNKDLSKKFPGWYKAYLNGLLGYKVRSLKVNKNYYCYQYGNYVLLKIEKWIII